jgi:hypothetical protein
MAELTPTDLRFVVTRIPKDVREMLMAQPFFCGGGFIRETIAGGKVSDADIFGPSKGALLDAAEAFAKERRAKLHTTDNAITLLAKGRMPVQWITRWVFDDAQKCMESFDFTVCQAVIWFDNVHKVWKSVCADAFYSDLAAKRLVYTFPVRDEEAGGSMMRARKFLMRGYNIQAMSLGGVIARVAQKVNRWDELDEKGRAQVIGGLLQEVDPLLVVDGFDFVDENEGIPMSIGDNHVPQ